MKEAAPDGGETPPSAYHDLTFNGYAPSSALPAHLQQRIEAQRAQLLQAHSVLRCLHTVLLHAECDDAVFYADAASVVANLINNTAEELDSVHLR